MLLDKSTWIRFERMQIRPRCVILFQFCGNLNIYIRDESRIMNNWIILIILTTFIWSELYNLISNKNMNKWIILNLVVN